MGRTPLKMLSSMTAQRIVISTPFFGCFSRNVSNDEK